MFRKNPLGIYSTGKLIFSLWIWLLTCMLLTLTTPHRFQSRRLSQWMVTSLICKVQQWFFQLSFLVTYEKTMLMRNKRPERLRKLDKMQQSGSELHFKLVISWLLVPGPYKEFPGTTSFRYLYILEHAYFLLKTRKSANELWYINKHLL